MKNGDVMPANAGAISNVMNDGVSAMTPLLPEPTLRAQPKSTTNPSHRPKTSPFLATVNQQPPLSG